MTDEPVPVATSEPDEGVAAESASGRLPVTGRSIGTLVLIAVALVVGGTVLARARRRRHT